MKRRITLTLSTAALLAAIAVSPSLTPAQTSKPAEKKSAAAAKVDKNALPLPVAVTFNRQNSPQDMLRVEVTYARKEGDRFIAYARIIWGDLDNRIKGGGKQFYSNWDGSLQLRLDTAVATVDKKVVFDDKPSRNGKKSEPRPGSGRDAMGATAGTTVTWDAAVVGHLDGLLIKITTDKAITPGTIKAGNFSTDFIITPEPVTR